VQGLGMRACGADEVRVDLLVRVPIKVAVTAAGMVACAGVRGHLPVDSPVSARAQPPSAVRLIKTTRKRNPGLQLVGGAVAPYNALLQRGRPVGREPVMQSLSSSLCTTLASRVC
jgi:hypothetical protein